MFAIELGNGALVDGLPGVPAGSSYVGTFDREEAVENETIDFFASGHPLVEGIFAHYEESPLGRVVRFEIEIGAEKDAGLVAIYKKDGPSRWSRSTSAATRGPTGRRRSAGGRSLSVPSSARPPRITSGVAWFAGWARNSIRRAGCTPWPRSKSGRSRPSHSKRRRYFMLISGTAFPP